VLNGDLPGVIRAKGHFWVATRPNWIAEFSLTGAMSQVAPLWGGGGRPFPKTAGQMIRWRLRMQRHWAEPWGDRRQELVFIGAGMDPAAITAALDACLIATETFTPSAWSTLPDPFPRWGNRAA
jgi:G3E family GTPase